MNKSYYIIIALCVCRLLHASEQVTPPYSWRGSNGQGVFPAADLVTSFYDFAPDMLPVEGAPGKPGERKNIVWRTALPHWGVNTPVVVGNKVFVMCEDGWKSDAPELVCLDVVSGTILWQKPIDGLDARSPAAAKRGKEVRAKHLEYYRSYMTAWNALYWDDEGHHTSTLGLDEAKKVVDAVTAETGWKFGGYRAMLARLEKSGKSKVSLKGGYQLWRGRWYHKDEGNPESKAIFEEMLKERYHWFPDWSTEGPFYGNAMGSVVSDGKAVYGLTALHAAAAFDMNGKRLWITDFSDTTYTCAKKSPGSYSKRGHRMMASPVLAGQRLVYYSWDAGEMFALDTKTGEIAWRVLSPRLSNDKGVRGHMFHMGPGGTPVVMNIDDTVVVVSGHGLVVRVSDGKLLGQVSTDEHYKERTFKGKTTPAGVRKSYPAGYTSFVGNGDVFFWSSTLKKLFASQLSIQDDQLQHKILWGGTTYAPNAGPPNFTIFDNILYADVSAGGKRGGGVKRVSLVDGEILGSAGKGKWAVYTQDDMSVAVGASGGLRLKGVIDRSEVKNANPDKKPGFGMRGYEVRQLPNNKHVGFGYLCPPAPVGEIADRHRAMIGTKRIVPGDGGISAWGNRIFIRDNDYIWCIGDPAVKWKPPEEYMK